MTDNLLYFTFIYYNTTQHNKIQSYKNKYSVTKNIFLKMQEKNILKPILINKFDLEINDKLLIFSHIKENKINYFLNEIKFNDLS